IIIIILLFLLLGVSLGLASPSGLSEVKVKLVRGGCPPFWFSFKGRCYKYVSSHLTWADAELYCVSERANLVSIHSLEEHNFVKSLIQNFDHRQGLTWIGLSDTQKEGWMWSDGSPVDFSQWNTGEPNNVGGNEDCALVNFGSELKWNDGTCSDRRPSVCVLLIHMCPMN
uniref:C-type lectin domain-containing protein n=1 Tax=Neogobius melanostomus TaxID=47308 RepID=A0A8C6SID7_9GOBI